MDLVFSAHENGRRAARASSRQLRKELGQFMTPPAIARAMALRTCVGIDQPDIRVLDPAAGGGILAAAIVETLLSNTAKPKHLHLVLYEVDSRLKTALEQSGEKMRRAGASVGVNVTVSVRIGDFLMSKLACEGPQFDIVIANPPYFKLNKDDPRSRRHAYAVHGQPNIYAIFMAACARLVARGGSWCFITPRSWTNGTYFAAARRQILQCLRINAMHVFESRQEHFTEDEVLQEAMITWATAQVDVGGTITVSSSEGIRDLPQATLQAIPTCDVIAADNRDVISIPARDREELLQGFTARLSSYGMKVSTGPVVGFRAENYLTECGGKGTVPLLWMQHVQHMRISWPIKKKREHIRANADTAWMLLPNANMVIMRRFSPKEDPRRIIAAPYLAHTVPGMFLGLENHTNYIYRPGGDLAPAEVKGMAAFLNSRLVDRYLRAVAGNTQVNAADLRSLPLPPLSQIIAIGHALPDSCTLEQADSAIESVLGVQRNQQVA